MTRFTRFMGELCRAESSSELQPHLSSSTRIFLRSYAIFTITFDAYQFFLTSKQLISLGRQVVHSKRILTVLLDERKGEYEVRTVGTRPRLTQMACIGFSPQHLLARAHFFIWKRPFVRELIRRSCRGPEQPSHPRERNLTTNRS